MAQTATTPTVAQLQDRVQELESVVYDIDALAQNGLRQITGIAKLALAALESPAACRHPESIAQALHAIWGIAEQTDNCINGNAEAAGCSYHDESLERRLAARYATQEV